MKCSIVSRPGAAAHSIYKRPRKPAKLHNPMSPYMKAASSFLLCLAISGPFASADEQIRRVQEELRKRNLYFGDIDGQASKETQGALRRYQERKGFSPTGEADGDTLRSLNLAAPIALANAQPWPDVPVLKSHAARQISEEDQKFLSQLSNEPVEPVGEAPDSEEEVVQVAPPTSGSPSTGSGPESAKASPPAATDPALQKRVEAFVRQYLDVAEMNDADGEVGFFADSVNYFDHGRVERKFIARDVQNYNKRWPTRDFDVESVKVTAAPNKEAIVKFRLKFHVKNPQGSATGRTENTFRVKEEEDGKLKFVSAKEKRLRE